MATPPKSRNIYEDVSLGNMASALADYAEPLPMYDWVNTGARFLEQGVKAPLNALQRKANVQRESMGMEPKPLMEITTPKPRESVQFGPAAQADPVIQALTAPPKQNVGTQNTGRGMGPLPADVGQYTGGQGLGNLNTSQLTDRWYQPVTEALARTAPKADNTQKPQLPSSDSAQANTLMNFLGVLSQAGLGPLLDKNFSDFTGYLQNDENNARMRDVANAQSQGKSKNYQADTEVAILKDAAQGGPDLVAEQLASLGVPPVIPLNEVLAAYNEFGNDPQALAQWKLDLWNEPLIMQRVAASPYASMIEGRADGGEVGGKANPVAEGAPAEMDSGDYVIPADVLRFYGSKFFNQLIEKADSD